MANESWVYTAAGDADVRAPSPEAIPVLARVGELLRAQTGSPPPPAAPSPEPRKDR